MTRADIENVQIEVAGGIHDVMKKIVAHEGNGLIIELTAKPQTRFYLHHDKYGDSNEVTVNLEGNKEYRLDAELCHLQSIVVETNTVDANVYIDDVFQGMTNATKSLTIENVMFGPHKLRVEKGSAKRELDIEVNSTSISFKLDITPPKPMFVTLTVTPKHAQVMFAGKQIALDAEGGYSTLVAPGTYNYAVSANDYHDETGTITVGTSQVVKNIKLAPAFGWLKIENSESLSGAAFYINGNYKGVLPLKRSSIQLSSGEYKIKIVKSLYNEYNSSITISDGQTLEYKPQLVPNYAEVEIQTDAESKIYVNNIEKGVGLWRGKLEAGIYQFEAKKDNHKSRIEYRTIVASEEPCVINIPAPEPIVSEVVVTSSPTQAEVYVDGELIGKTPVTTSLIVGGHSVKISKEGYVAYKGSLEVKEGVRSEISNVQLKKACGVLSVSGQGSLDGAEVYVDRKLVGKAPLKCDTLTVGTHSLVIVKSGYKSVRKEFNVGDNETYSYTTVLQPITGTLWAISVPAGAKVYVDGKFTGSVTDCKRQLMIGKHRVELRKDGYKVKCDTIVIEEGKTSVMNVVLDNVSTNYPSLGHLSDDSNSNEESSNGKSCKVKYSVSNCAVYVDGEYKGVTNSSNIWFTYGSHYIVVRSGGSYYGRTIYVNSATSVIDMNYASRVSSVHPNSSSSSSSTSSSTSSSSRPSTSYSGKTYSGKTYSGSSALIHRKPSVTREKKGGFNVGISIGGGYEAVEEYGEFNVGLLWRLWRHDSRFNVMTGASYMRTYESNFLAIPAVVNLNYMKDKDMGMYIGVGTEFTFCFDDYSYSNTVYYDYPVVVQTGIGSRHFDLNLYLKYYAGFEFCVLGVRAAYLF
jgi:diacylglycerol kinase family enzyme